MPYKLDCTPAPVTLTMRRKLDWRILFPMGWAAFVAYFVLGTDWRRTRLSDHVVDIVVLTGFSILALLSLIRRERIEIYPDRMVWRSMYFGITKSKTALLDDVVGAEWSEGHEDGEGGKTPDHVEFYLPVGSVKACHGMTFEEFDRMREDIRGMYPDLIKRWGRANIRSKDFTLLNLS